MMMKRWKQCYADYILTDKWIHLAVIEAKKQWLPPTDGLEQVKEYGKKLDIRWVYSTNGQKIYEFDLQEWTGYYIDAFPTPKQLYQRYIDPSATLKQQLLAVPYRSEWSIKPRYYQHIAVTRTLSAIAEWQDRILLTLATGTGKTRIAYWISQKLFDAKWTHDDTNRRPRILFLADRNILVDQAMNTYNPLEKDILKVTWKEIRKRNGRVPTNANVFFAIYQAIISGSDEETETRWVDVVAGESVSGYYEKYPADFFDLIIIDECHRWWANEAGTWHAILKHFSSAVQLWLTATPKREDNIDTYRYFGDPLYEYSLKEWINDGFLTPYKVKRIQTSLDELVLTDEDIIIQGEKEKDVYTVEEFNRSIVLPQYNDLIAEKIIQEMKPNDKAIVFCVDQQHAANMRDSINKFKQVKHPDYCVRVTSNEWDIGRQFLEDFQDNDKTIPTILTSSQMLTTWVDAKNVRTIVLLRNIGSMVEFKQIIWRWTRLFEWKEFFTIMDFTWATKKFYDEEWDGPPAPVDSWDERDDVDSVHEPEPDYTPDEQPDDTDDIPWWTTPTPRPPKLEVQLSNDRTIRIINTETRYIDESWKPMSASEFLEQLVGKLPSLYKDEEQLRKLRANPDTRKELLSQLQHMWVSDEQFDALKVMFEAPDSDIFDILAHLSFSSQMKTRHERAIRVRDHKIIFDQVASLEAKEFLEFVLSYYEDHGSTELIRDKIGNIIDLYGKGTTPDMMKVFGWGDKLLQAWYSLQKELFRI